MISNGLGVSAADIDKMIAPGLLDDMAHFCADCFHVAGVSGTITRNASSSTIVLEFKVEHRNLCRSTLLLSRKRVRHCGQNISAVSAAADPYLLSFNFRDDFIG